MHEQNGTTNNQAQQNSFDGQPQIANSADRRIAELEAQNAKLVADLSDLTNRFNKLERGLLHNEG